MSTIEVAQATEATAAALPRVSERRQMLLGLLHDRTAMLGVAFVGIFIFAAIFAPLLSPHDPNATDVVNKFAQPSPEFPLGTDHLGRDVLARLLYGARVSIGATVLTAAVITLVGILLGMLAGYVGGIVDTVISRVIDILLAFPLLLLALALIGVLGPSLRNLMLAVIVVAWAGYARIMRASVLAEREKPYIEAARMVGASPTRILRRHLLPNIVAPIVVLTTLDMAGILLVLSALSFLGLGVQPPTPEWGAMLSEGSSYLARAPNLMLFPGVAIFLMALGFNLFGDGLRDVLDPRTRGLPDR